jgi:hypothetical protein
MKKTLLAAALLSATVSQSMAANDLESAFKESKVMGQFRAFYIDRDYDVVNSKGDRSAFAIGGKFGFETAAVNGLKFGIMAYSTNGINTNRESWRNNPPYNGNPHMDPSLFEKDRKSVTYIGQLYLDYKYQNTAVKIGRQEINTPMAGMDDARMLPNLFEGALITNKDIPKTTIIAGHFWNMAYGTFANAYSACSYLGLQSGYGCGGYTALNQGLAKYDTGNFLNMGKQAIGKANAGVSVIAVIYEGIPNLKLQAWDYYAWDMLNILYLQGDYTLKLSDVKTTLSAQYINETNVGNNIKNATYINQYKKEVGGKFIWC